MNAEIQALNEKCARVVGGCVHGWRNRGPLRWQCRLYCKEIRSKECPPTTDDYCATAGSALEFCNRALKMILYRLEIMPSPDSVDVWNIKYVGQEIYQNEISVEYKDYDSIDRALGVAICKWCLKILGDK